MLDDSFQPGSGIRRTPALEMRCQLLPPIRAAGRVAIEIIQRCRRRLLNP